MLGGILGTSMWLHVVGLPSPALRWGLHIARTIVAVAGGDLAYRHATDVRDLVDVSTGNTAGSVIGSDSPSTALCRHLASKKLPVTVFRDDPLTVVAWIMNGWQLDFLSALRTASLCFSTVHDVSEQCASFVVDADGDAPLAKLVSAIASRHGAAFNAEDIAQVLERIDGHADETFGRFLARQSATALDLSLSVEEQHVVNAVLGSFRQAARSFCWPTSTLMDVHTKGAPVQEVYDMTGPSRFLTYGPYFCLPCGRWAAEWQFTVQENHSGNVLILDIAAGTSVVPFTAKLPSQGVFSAEFEFSVEEARTPIQMRAALGEGAIEGRLAVGPVQLRRLE